MGHPDMMSLPKNALALLRLSDLRVSDLDAEGNSPSLADQEARIRAFGSSIGWTVARVIVENDLAPRNGKMRAVSAFKRRKIRLPDGRVELRTVRPAFREALNLLATGRHDGLVVLDADRAFRDMRDLEDTIDVVEARRVPVQSVTGSLRLANDADITMARVMVAMGNKSSRDAARRVSAARERQANTGVYGGGRRPFGFDDDGSTIRPAEASVVEEMTERVLQGASLKSLALDLRGRDVATVTGARWTAETLRDILLRPRNAGRMVYQGTEVGDAPWEPIVPLDTFRALAEKLTDPKRRTQVGAAPKWLGSGLYRCGICHDGTTVQVRVAGRQPVYRCKNYSHAVRAVAYVDALVVGTILERLGRQDAADMFLPTRPDVDVTGLRTEAATIKANLKQMAADAVLGKLDKEEMYEASKAARQRLEQIDTQLQAATVPSPLSPLVGTEDIDAAWQGLPLARRRLVVDTMVTVTILPGRRGRGFDPSTVDIDWKQQQAA